MANPTGTGASGTLFTVPLGPGKAFIADTRYAPDVGPLEGFRDSDELCGWFFDRFRDAYAAKRPELERLKMLELYYSGFHFTDPIMNRQMKVTNFCFATVETVLPILCETKPRPEIVPRRTYHQQDVQDLQDYAQWLMDTTEWDMNHVVNNREKLKYGWCVHLLVVDPRTGICHPRPWSVFDFYKDPYCRNEDEMEWCFLASPVPTRWLQDQYPDQASKIVSDNIASPSYDVLERPYYEQWVPGGTYSTLDTFIGSPARLETDPPAIGSRVLVPIPNQNAVFNVGTTFLVTMLVRDRRDVPVHYGGNMATLSPDGQTWTHSPTVQMYRQNEPVTPSGWRMVRFTATGTFLESSPVDECFLGLPLEIGRDHPQAGRFYGPGELDHIIPINRSMNRRYGLLNRSLEYEAVPVLVADTSTGIDIDQKPIEPADVLKKQPGSQIQWLTFGGAGAQQFEMLGIEKQDMDTISGVHDVTEGRRPAGIEAAAAIRDLQMAAQTRIRGKEIPIFNEQCRMLKKMMVATARKAQGPIWFRANTGDMKALDPSLAAYEFDVRFAEGTGTAVSRAAQEDKILSLRQLGLMDAQSTLERLSISNVPEVLKRLNQERMLASAPAGPPPGAAPGKKPPMAAGGRPPMNGSPAAQPQAA